MKTTDYIVEVLPNRSEASAAIDELIDLGSARTALRTSVRPPSHHAIDFDADSVFGRFVATGMLIGVPLCCLLALVIVAIAASRTGSDLAIGAAGAAGGVVVGLLLGGLFGVAASNRATETAELISEIPTSEDQVVVALRGRRDGSAIREVLERHGGRSVDAHFELQA